MQYYCICEKLSVLLQPYCKYNKDSNHAASTLQLRYSRNDTVISLCYTLCACTYHSNVRGIHRTTLPDRPYDRTYRHTGEHGHRRRIPHTALFSSSPKRSADSSQYRFCTHIYRTFLRFGLATCLTYGLRRLCNCILPPAQLEILQKNKKLYFELIANLNLRTFSFLPTQNSCPFCKTLIIISIVVATTNGSVNFYTSSFQINQARINTSICCWQLFEFAGYDYRCKHH